MFDLAGQTAVVTGSTAGIGLAIARCLGQHGAQIVVSSHDEDDVARTVPMLLREGLNVVGLVCDVGDETSVSTFPENVTKAVGTVDILVIHANVPAPIGPVLDTARKDMAETFTGVVNNIQLIQGFVPLMAESGGGSVIVTSSIASIRASVGLGIYGAGKAAMDSVVRNLAAEWGDKNIRANSIAPAMVRTPFSAAAWATPEGEARVASKTAVGRLAEPDDIVGAVLLLASSAGSYITGQSIPIDGGRSIL